MRLNDVTRARDEAERFIAAVDKLQVKGDRWRVGQIVGFAGGKHTAAVKRASADLSNALVEIRKSPGRK